MIETQYKKEKDALIEKYEAEILILKNIIEDRALARPITPAIIPCDENGGQINKDHPKAK